MFRKPYAQLRIVANPGYDMDFIEWWKRLVSDSEAKSHFLGYVKTGLVMRYQKLPTNKGGQSNEVVENHKPTAKRGRKKKIEQEKFSVRLHISSNSFGDIIDAWNATPKRHRSRVFLSLWRHGRGFDQDPVLMLLPGGKLQESRQTVVVEPEIVATSVRSAEALVDSLAPDMEVIMELWNAQQVSNS